MITLSITHLIILGVILLYILFKNREYKSKIASPERIYVDTSGVSVNPPNFIEVLKNKTINFDIGTHAIKITHITPSDGFTSVNLIASLFSKFSDLMEKIPENKIERIKNNLLKAGIYKQIVYEIYNLSKSFTSGNGGYRRALIDYSKTHEEEIFLIVDQIFDYWMYIKKLVALLSKGGSKRMILGEGCTWNSYETDMTGNRIIKPRFGLSMN